MNKLKQKAIQLYEWQKKWNSFSQVFMHDLRTTGFEAWFCILPTLEKNLEYDPYLNS